MNIFLDSNILVYSFDHREPEKREKAKNLLRSLKAGADHPVISTQVMQEVYNILTRKLAVAPADAAAELRVLTALQTVILTPDLILTATELHTIEQKSLSFWDSLIIAAAQSANCSQLWSEDMQDGRTFGTLQIVNPLARR